MHILKQEKQSDDAANPFFSELFAKRSGTDDREQQWRKAIAHVGGGLEPMRFPVYESLFLINTQSQKLLHLLEETSQRYDVFDEQLPFFRSMIQCVRAGASQEIVSLMNDVEITEEWLFERLRLNEQEKLQERD
jgi:hypothetical protein